MLVQGFAMIVVRSDTIGQVDMRLVSRPTNTCIGVNNFHFYAESNKGLLDCPVVRFFGTDSELAIDRYHRALGEANLIREELSR